ncbi:hypothetical protein HK405_003298 [Cladochytrium tenue]|nr:hypothetical protein HK405_003298 [Cladochytrium tenue]
MVEDGAVVAGAGLPAGAVKSPGTAAAATPAGGEDDGSWAAMTVPGLKAACKERGLKVSGKKADLIARLVEWRRLRSDVRATAVAVTEGEEGGATVTAVVAAGLAAAAVDVAMVEDGVSARVSTAAAVQVGADKPHTTPGAEETCAATSAAAGASSDGVAAPADSAPLSTLGSGVGGKAAKKPRPAGKSATRSAAGTTAGTTAGRAAAVRKEGKNKPVGKGGREGSLSNQQLHRVEPARPSGGTAVISPAGSGDAASTVGKTTPLVQSHVMVQPCGPVRSAPAPASTQSKRALSSSAPRAAPSTAKLAAPSPLVRQSPPRPLLAGVPQQRKEAPAREKASEAAGTKVSAPKKRPALLPTTVVAPHPKRFLGLVQPGKARGTAGPSPRAADGEPQSCVGSESERSHEVRVRRFVPLRRNPEPNTALVCPAAESTEEIMSTWDVGSSRMRSDISSGVGPQGSLPSASEFASAGNALAKAALLFNMHRLFSQLEDGFHHSVAGFTFEVDDGGQQDEIENAEQSARSIASRVARILPRLGPLTPPVLEVEALDPLACRVRVGFSPSDSQPIDYLVRRLNGEVVSTVVPPPQSPPATQANARESSHSHKETSVAATPAAALRAAVPSADPIFPGHVHLSILQGCGHKSSSGGGGSGSEEGASEEARVAARFVLTHAIVREPPVPARGGPGRRAAATPWAYPVEHPVESRVEAVRSYGCGGGRAGDIGRAGPGGASPAELHSALAAVVTTDSGVVLVLRDTGHSLASLDAGSCVPGIWQWILGCDQLGWPRLKT